jgi:hypothetical protein
LKSIAINIGRDPAFSSSESGSKFAIAAIVVIADLAYVVVAEEPPKYPLRLVRQTPSLACYVTSLTIMLYC